MREQGLLRCTYREAVVRKVRGCNRFLLAARSRARLPHGANSQYLTNAHTSGTITKKARPMVPSTEAPETSIS